MAGIKLDSIDLNILRILQENGKITNIQLSQEVGLSPAPTLERVRKLEKNGIIKSYHAALNEDILELGFTALIQVALDRQKKDSIQNFLNHINGIHEITECYQVTGNFDYQLKVVVKDIPAFEALIADKLSNVEEIGQMQTMVVLSKVKQSRVLPIDYNGKLKK